jgi:hypothetical protein
MRIRSPKDFYAGALFVTFGLGFTWVAWSYPLGTLRHMGPAYFPVVLGVIMTVLGILVAARAVTVDNPAPVRLFLRPLLLLMAGAVLFAVMIRGVGLVAALAGLVFVSALGGSEFRFREVVILWVALSILSVAIFIYGLGLPFKMWPR